MKYSNFEALIGAKIFKASDKADEIRLETDRGVFRIYHIQDCCESVIIHKKDDLEKLAGQIVTVAEESFVEAPDDLSKDRRIDSETWTLQKINDVSILWWGQSNGYYGETPHIVLEETIKTVDLSEDLELQRGNLQPSIIKEA